MRKTSILIVIALIAILISAAFPMANPVSADNIDRYGYSLLTNDKQKAAYEAIADGISKLTTEIKFSCEGITPEDVEAAGAMIVRDYPEYFWYDGAAQISVTGKDVIFSTSEYKVDGQTVTADSAALITAKNQLEAAINKAVAKLPSNPSQYEIAHTFHDYVVNNVTYEKTGDHQTAYGALVTGKAVCTGYARAFQLLMNKAGIRCWYVGGDSYDPEGNLVPHSWNLYWLDGKCYYSDATWDDQGDELFHEYLNMSLEEISKTHFTEDILPASCNHNDYTFFIKNDGKGVCDIRDHKNAKEAAKCFEIKTQKGDRVEYYCTIHYHEDDFVDWINNNAGAIVQELGFKSVDSINIIELGHEHHVTITGQLKAAPKPTEPTPTTKPTEPVPTTKPTEPTPTTKPTEPVPTTKPTEPTPTTKPTEPVPTTKPTDPVPTTKPTESTATTGSTTPSDPSDPTQQTTSQVTTEPTSPAVTVKPSATTGTTLSGQTNTDTKIDSGKTVIIIAACVAAVAGIGVAVYFFVIKKK